MEGKKEWRPCAVAWRIPQFYLTISVRIMDFLWIGFGDLIFSWVGVTVSAAGVPWLLYWVQGTRINVSNGRISLQGILETQITIHSKSYSIIHTVSFQFYLPLPTLEWILASADLQWQPINLWKKAMWHDTAAIWPGRRWPPEMSNPRPPNFTW